MIETLSFSIASSRNRVDRFSRTIIACAVAFVVAMLPVSMCGQSASSVALPVRASIFEFHSDFWINLHHFLYEQALPQEHHHGPRKDGNSPKLTPDEQKAWDGAVQYYRQNIISHDLLFDPAMKKIDTVLAAAEGQTAVSGEAVTPELAHWLNLAAPMYRRYWWAQQDRINRFWIAQAIPLVTSLGPQMKAQLEQVYQESWPTRPVRVDVAGYANWAGAYTNVEPDGIIHTIMSSVNPIYQGYGALEMLFHEASHGIVDGQSGRIANDVRKDAQADGMQPPQALVHAIIFYTAGEFAWRDLAAMGVHDYKPSASSIGLWNGQWRNYHSALALFWQAHIDGKLSLDDSIAKVVDALAVVNSPSPHAASGR